MVPVELLSLSELLVLLAVLATSVLVTAAVRHYAVRAALLDTPNERSSHTVPTPRGGGLGIVLAVLAGLGAATRAGWIEGPLFMALAGGGALVAGIGLLDDRGHVHAAIRAMVQLVAAVWALYLFSGMPTLHFGNSILQLGPLGWVVGVLGIVWFTNLYNFMDGIDGMAAGEAVSVGAAAALLATVTGDMSVRFIAALVAAAAAGFLFWNWEPARIFMGDVGSGFLGYTLAVLALAAESGAGPPLLVWVILLGVFIFDATVTLVRRAARGEQWFAAHRGHAYQRMVQSGIAHARVVTYVLAINAGLGLLGLASVLWPDLLVAWLAIALGALAVIYLWVERRRPMSAKMAEWARRVEYRD